MTVEDVPGTWYTDPDSGRFAIDLPAGSTYRVTVTPQAAGYTAKTQDVTIDDGDVAEDFLVPIDTESCTAPGYAPSFDGARATFDTTTLPAGWSVVDHEGSGLVWRLDDPADRGNLTGGDGGFAVLDSDYYTNTGRQDSSLVSSDVDLSDAEHPAVEFANDFKTLAGVQADLDVSLDQGASWQTVWTRNTDARGPVTVRVPIPQAAGHPDVRARWHYHEGHWTGWWQVDDAFIGERSCRKVRGGLVHGQVTDANTGTPVVGATVTSEDDPSARATTIATPGDNALPDGYFSVFSPEVNDHPFSASMPRYRTDVRTVHVATDWSTRADFALAAGVLVMKPHHVGGTATLGKDVTRHVTITNTGTAPATYRFAESQQGFVIQRADGSRSTSQQLMTSQGARVRYVRTPTITPAAQSPAATPASAPTAPAAGAPAAAPWLGIADYPTTIKDSAAGYHDGRVYSFGGTVSGYGPTPASYVYDPATLGWSALADMPDGRQKPASAFVDGKFYVVGGWGAAGRAEAATLVYDPAVDRWTTAADNPHPSGAVGSAVLDGKIYSVGGCSGECQSASRQVTAYDVATNRFQTLAPYPEEISWPSCGGIDGRVYCAGGLTAGPESSERAYAYDPQADSWTPVAQLPVDLWGSSYAVANGQLVVSGGAARDGSMLTNETFAYDPSTDAWTALPPSNDAVYRGAAACGFTKVGGGSGARVIAWSETLPGYDDCEEAGTDAAWLREGRIHGTLAPHHSVTVTLKLDAGRVSQPGVYRARLIARTNTPYDALSSSVRLTAVAPPSWARLSGRVLGKACDGTRDPLPGATLAIDRGKSSWTLLTDADGAYALWVPGRKKPARLVGARDGYRPASADVRLRPGRRVTRTLVLRRLGC